jgi:hypothetical protein
MEQYNSCKNNRRRILKEIKEFENEQTRSVIDEIKFDQNTNFQFVDENLYQLQMKEYNLKNQVNNKTCGIWKGIYFRYQFHLDMKYQMD